MEFMYDGSVVYDNAVIWIEEKETDLNDEEVFVELPPPPPSWSKPSQKFGEPVTVSDIKKEENDVIEDNDIEDPLADTKSSDRSPQDADFEQAVRTLTSFSKTGYYEKNVMRDMKSKTYMCAYCGHTVFARNELSRHIFESHSSHLTRIPSGLCVDVAIREPTRKKARHSLQFLKISRVFFCGKCDYRTIQPTCMIEHIKLVHTAYKYYSCNYCDYKTLDHTNMKTHILNVHLNKRLMICTKCPYSTYYGSDMRRHKEKHHSEVKEFKCDMENCEYKTLSTKQLAAHKTVAHKKAVRNALNAVSSSGVVACKECDFTTINENLLNKHMRTKHKKFQKCPKCDFSAQTKAKLKLHITNNHADVSIEKETEGKATKQDKEQGEGNEKENEQNSAPPDLFEETVAKLEAKEEVDPVELKPKTISKRSRPRAKKTPAVKVPKQNLALIPNEKDTTEMILGI